MKLFDIAASRPHRAVKAAVTAVALSLCASLASAQTAAKPVNMTIGSFVQGSSWYVYSVALGELLRGTLPAGSTIDTPPIAGALANPSLVATGKAQIAFGMAVVGNWALEGKHAFKEPLPNLRALVGGWDDYYLVPLVRGKGVNPDLAAYFQKVQPKARVVLLQRGGVGAFGGQHLLDMAGAGESALTSRGGSYEFGTFDMVKSRFSGGTADVFVQVATLGHPSITEIAQNTPVTFMEPSKAVLDSMAKQYGWELRVLPAGTFPGQTKDIPLPGSTTMLFASTALSDDMAYTITKTVCEQTAQLRASHKALSKFDCSDGKWKREVTGLPLHPGAERYFREKGWLK
jgi:uncharacterized protein